MHRGPSRSTRVSGRSRGWRLDTTRYQAKRFAVAALRARETALRTLSPPSPRTESVPRRRESGWLAAERAANRAPSRPVSGSAHRCASTDRARFEPHSAAVPHTANRPAITMSVHITPPKTHRLFPLRPKGFRRDRATTRADVLPIHGNTHFARTQRYTQGSRPFPLPRPWSLARNGGSRPSTTSARSGHFRSAQRDLETPCLLTMRDQCASDAVR